MVGEASGRAGKISGAKREGRCVTSFVSTADAESEGNDYVLTSSSCSWRVQWSGLGASQPLVELVLLKFGELVCQVLVVDLRRQSKREY